MPELVTQRLRIRPRGPDDFAPYHALMSNWEVARWTASWPWPADPDYTLERLSRPHPVPGIDGVILYDGAFAGSITLARGEIGYAVLPGLQRRGIATEACTAVIDWGFSLGLDRITAGVFDGNPGSAHLLRKLGFVETGRDTVMCRAQGRPLPGPDFALTREVWDARAQRPCGPGPLGRGASD